MWFRDCIVSGALYQCVLKEATLARDGQKHTLHMDCDYSSPFTCRSSNSHSLSSFTKVLPRWKNLSAHLLLCTCWLKAFTSTGVWWWLRQWLLSFLKHSRWETAARAEQDGPVPSLLSKRPPTVLTGTGHMGGYLLKGTSQEMRYCRP